MAREPLDFTTIQPDGRVGENSTSAFKKIERMFTELYTIWNLFTDTGKNAISAAVIRASLALRPGTDIQAYNVKLQSISDITVAADKGIYATGTSAFATYDLTSFSRSLSAKADQATWRTALGVGTADVPFFGGIELSSGLPFIDFHYNNTTTDFNVRLINDAGNALTVVGASWARFRVAGGYGARAGDSGTFSGNSFNFNWSGGSLQAWIDTTNVGTVTLSSSDYRIKKNIKSVTEDFVARVNAYRVVTYEYRQQGAWKGATETMQGLIAHEAKEANPLAATGEKDEVDENGNMVIQNLNTFAIMSDLIGAVQQQAVQISALQATVEELRSQLASNQGQA